MLQNLGLYADYYEFTMAQGYYYEGYEKTKANFDYFFRSLPFGGGYAVFAGLGDLVENLKKFRFGKRDLEFLRERGFKSEFLTYLQKFRFRGDIYSVREGEVVFANEPLIRVEAGIIEAQLIESILLNLINFESLIATKASRIKQVVGERIFIDFGLRRAQGFGSIHASKASVIGGADGSSHVLSAFLYNIQTSGTMAHSWIESFESEIIAFRKFVEHHPENCILLVDTYDTLRSGLPNAITVAKEMKERGQQLRGIRLDSGDLSYLSKQARKMLNNAGLEDVKIMVSNQLDEYIIKSLIEQDSPIDGFGVGTKLVVGDGEGAFDGVYKLTFFNGKPRMKKSDNLEKVVLPGIKKVYRYLDERKNFFADGILLEKETHSNRIYHPVFQSRTTNIRGKDAIELLHQVIKDGEPVSDLTSVHKAADYCRERMALLPEEHKRFENPHIYKVGISPELKELQKSMIKEIGNTF